MRITVTGATGLIGTQLVEELLSRGDQVTVLARNPHAAQQKLGSVEAVSWNPTTEQAPPEALAHRDAVIHLAGEPVSQRWTADAKNQIRESRVAGTSNLIAGLRQADPSPKTLVSGSAVGYYGAHGPEPVDETAAPGEGFLAEVCVDWEKSALEATELGIRTVLLRTGVVLSSEGGALAKMLPPFKAGVGGPVAGGEQFVPWIHIDDIVGLILAAIDGDDSWSGPLNATAPVPVTNKQLSKALGRALHRPSIAPVPAFAIKLLYGEMSEIVTTGQNAIPSQAQSLGYGWKNPDLDLALQEMFAS